MISAISRRVGQARPPRRLALLAGPLEVAQGAAERLGERRVGDVALVHVELPRQEDAARSLDRAQELVHQDRFPHARVARDQRQRRPAAGQRLVQHRLQRGQLRLAPVKVLRDLQLIRHVQLAEREGIDAPLRDPLAARPLEIVAQAARALVAVLRHLLHQPADDRGDERRDRRGELPGRRHRPRDVGVDPAQRVLRRERQLAGQHQEEQHARGVEVAAAVDRAVHAPGLLG
jgi:hypothetical protein